MFPKCTSRDTFTCFQNVPAETHIHVSKMYQQRHIFMFPKCTSRDTFSCFQNVLAETHLHVSKMYWQRHIFMFPKCTSRDTFTCFQSCQWRVSIFVYFKFERRLWGIKALLIKSLHCIDVIADHCMINI